MSGTDRTIFEIVAGITAIFTWFVSIYRIMFKVQNHIQDETKHFMGEQKGMIMAHIADKSIHSSEKAHIETEVRLVRLEQKMDSLLKQVAGISKTMEKMRNESK